MSAGALPRRPARPSVGGSSNTAGVARKADRRLGYLLVAPAVLLLLLVTGYPLVYNLWNSFHQVILSNAGAPQSFVGLKNYEELATATGFPQALARTLAFMVVSVVLETVAGLGLALMLHKAFRGRGVLRAAILVPWAVPTVVSALLWTTMFDPRSGFVDYVLGILHLPGSSTTWMAGEWTAWTAVLVADAWKNVPFIAIILLAGLQLIPGDVYEAARIDGATSWQAFRRMTLPLLRPALMVALIFRTLQAFLVFDIIYIMTGGGPGTTTETLSYLNWQAFLVDTNFGYGGAISISLVVISLLIAGGIVLVMRPKT